MNAISIESLTPIGHLTIPPAERTGYACLSEATCPDVTLGVVGTEQYAVVIAPEITCHSGGERTLALPAEMSAAIIAACAEGDPLIALLA